MSSNQTAHEIPQTSIYEYINKTEYIRVFTA